MSWDPAEYLKFADERTRPAFDLLARIALASPATVYDLGCGSGNSTRLLRDRWPQARLTGVDSSEAMLERARRDLPDVVFERADVSRWRPAAPADVIFSNALLHWLDDHERLFPALLASLAGGGVLAVQMPRNFASPSHRILVDVVRGGLWRERLEPLVRDAPVHEPAVYYDLLSPRADVDVWETEYVHVLAGDDPVTEWVKGTALRPFLDALDGRERDELLALYSDAARRAYPRRADGRTLFPFRRLFIVATARG